MMIINQTLRQKIEEHLGLETYQYIIDKIVELGPIALRMNNLDVSREELGFISFCHVSSNGVESRKEQTMKITRFLNKFIDVNSKQFAGKVNMLYSDLISPAYYIEVVDTPGGAVEAYNCMNYADNCGSLNSSCMRIMSRSESGIKFYGKFKNTKIAILRKTGDSLVHGRAILWHGVTDMRTGKITNLMDTMYCCTTKTPIFNNFAKENGYHVVRDFDIFGDYKIELDKKYFVFPHLDTFRYLVIDEQDDKYTLFSDHISAKKSVSHYNESIVGLANGEIIRITKDNERVCKHCGQKFYLLEHEEGSEYCEECHESDALTLYKTKSGSFKYISRSVNELYRCEACGNYHIHSEIPSGACGVSSYAFKTFVQ